jgi:hypothetical protein
MSKGYWIQLEDGTTAHVNGDPAASPETKQAIEAVVRAAANMLREEEDECR